MQWCGKLASKQAITVAQSYKPIRHKPMLKAETILTLDLPTAWTQAKRVAPTISHVKGSIPALAKASKNVAAMAIVTEPPQK
jgi:hypothetical protein